MERSFSKNIDANLAYVLGFFAADGNLSRNKRNACYVSFQSKDRSSIAFVKKTLGVPQKISKRLNKNSGTHFYRIQIGSKKLFDEFSQLGFTTTKTNHLPFPNIPKKFFPSFLLGYFDGDGNVWSGLVHKERATSHLVIRISFTSGAEVFLKTLQEYLAFQLSTAGSLSAIKDKDCSRLQYGTKDSLQISKFMYNSPCPFFLKRKRVVFENYFKTIE